MQFLFDRAAQFISEVALVTMMGARLSLPDSNEVMLQEVELFLLV